MYFLIYCLEHHANLYQNQFKINMTLQGHAIETQLSKNAYLYLFKVVRFLVSFRVVSLSCLKLHEYFYLDKCQRKGMTTLGVDLWCNLLQHPMRLFIIDFNFPMFPTLSLTPYIQFFSFILLYIEPDMYP